MNADDFRFDRLVDDELNNEERRELLAGLDDEPGGWRRCALAFLESQCWKQTLGPMAREGVSAEAPARDCPNFRVSENGTVPFDSPWTRRAWTLLAMAACFLVTFWVGSLVQKARLVPPAAPAGVIGELAANTGNLPIPPVQPGSNLAGVVPPTQTPVNPWRVVTVSAPAGSSMRLPAVERNNVDPQWLQSLPPAIPDDVMQAFARSGHQVEQHRELVPVPLKDGRRLVMPVDQVDVHYVGNGTY